MSACQRKCWDCGNIATHADSVVPHVLCRKCGSQDTRLIRPKATTPFTDSEVNAAIAATIEEMESKYCDLMEAVKRSRLPHGDCKSGERYNGKPLACAACMANLKLDELISNYKGRRIVTA